MTTERWAAVFFDVDGVLLDSLPQHLRYCADKALQYGLRNLNIPAASEFKRMIGQGVSVSPMLNFFRALGFPEPLAHRGADDYEHEFMPAYRPMPFPGIELMLRTLFDAGLPLGLVTSNTRANVEPALADLMGYFNRRCLFYYEGISSSKDKTANLKLGAQMLGVAPERCCYVGDQPADRAAADAAGFRFLGVSYGWGFQEHDPRVRVVNDVRAIAEVLLDR